mmetsp:Transcript_8845/g.28250  ORF Transcript_8845/g.28250 Transcript_8845/m.28250 type:complete len:563 (-) Transcript_8845:233-1921(-)
MLWFSLLILLLETCVADDVLIDDLFTTSDCLARLHGPGVRSIAIIPAVTTLDDIALFEPWQDFQQKWAVDYMDYVTKHLWKVRDASDVQVSVSFVGSTVEPVVLGDISISDTSNVQAWVRSHPEVCDRCGEPGTRSPTAADLCLFAHPRLTTPRFGGGGLVVIEHAPPAVQAEPFHTLVHEVNHGMLAQLHDKQMLPSGQVSTYGNPYSVMGNSDARVRRNKNPITGVAHLLAAGLLAEADVLSLGDVTDGKPVILGAFDEGRAAGRSAGLPMTVRLIQGDTDPANLLYVSYRALAGVVTVTLHPRARTGYSTSSTLFAMHGVDDTADAGLHPGEQLWLPALDVVITVDAAEDHSSLTDDQILENIEAGVTTPPTATLRFSRISGLSRPPASCGNGRRDGVEMCDGGDLCDSSCRCARGSRPGGPTDRGCRTTRVSCSGTHVVDIPTSDGGSFTPSCIEATTAPATPWLSTYTDTRTAYGAAPGFVLRNSDDGDDSSLPTSTIAIVVSSVATACLMCTAAAGCVVVALLRRRASSSQRTAPPLVRSSSRRRTRRQSSLYSQT